MRTAWPALSLLLLPACAGEGDGAVAPERDPATEQALADQILVDPDLANQNEGNAALTVSSDHSLPLIQPTPEAIAAARAEAAVLVDGTDNLWRPPARRDGRSETPPATPAQAAARLPRAGPCIASITYSARWAANLPAALPVYPRAATLEAAGSDHDSCALRVATFVTPVASEDVLAFYGARARLARFGVEHAAGGSGDLLSGEKGASAFRLWVRVRDDGLTETTLATIG